MKRATTALRIFDTLQEERLHEGSRGSREAFVLEQKENFCSVTETAWFLLGSFFFFFIPFLDFSGKRRNDHSAFLLQKFIFNSFIEIVFQCGATNKSFTCKDINKK